MYLKASCNPEGLVPIAVCGLYEGRVCVSSSLNNCSGGLISNGGITVADLGITLGITIDVVADRNLYLQGGRVRLKSLFPEYISITWNLANH